ncbi:MAG: LPS-assembly protein LptD [Deltaproteobacteria bacterium]|nr:LPS-assembly protein LptD [Deltaproteobacteria bacterium]
MFLTALLLVLAGQDVLYAGRGGVLRGQILRDRNAHWQITADRLSYSKEDNLYIAEGNVVITRNGQVLSAQKAIYNEQTGIAQVSGGIRLTSNGDELVGEMGIFDLNNHNGQITQGRIFVKENHYYITGNAIIRQSAETYVVKGCRVTTCDGDNPAWSITGSEVKVTVEGYGTVKDIAFRIKDVPVLYLPWAIFPVKTKRQTGFLPPRLGYSNRNGADLEIPFFWAISEQTDATFYERYMSERGLMQGLEFRYITDPESRGTFLLDILSDRKDRKDLSDPDDVDLSPYERTNRTRYWFRGRADQNLPHGWEARVDADYVSDQDYLKEFQGGLFGLQARPGLYEDFRRPLEDVRSPTRRSALRLGYDRPDTSLHLLGAYHQRPEDLVFDETPEPVAGMDLSLLPRPLWDLPLFGKLDADYDYVWRDFGQKGHRMSLSPAFSYPMRFVPYLELEPSVRLTRHTQWLEDSGRQSDHQSRNVYQMETRLSTILERVFDGSWGNANRLKHKAVPSLTYTYRGYDDENTYRPWFEAVDEEGGANLVTLSLENFLDARQENDKGEVSYAQWGTFHLRQPYDIDEKRRDSSSRNREPFRPLEGELTVRPFSNLNLDAEAHWDHYSDDVPFADLSAELALDRSGGRKDLFSVDYLYERGDHEGITYRADINLVYGWSVGTRLTREMDRGDTIERSFWLEYEAQCWGIRLITEKLDEVESVMVTFSLLGLGEVKGR